MARGGNVPWEIGEEQGADGGRAVAFLAATYVAAGKLGLAMAQIHPSASAVWPPTGIALAAALIWGIGVWPAIFLGAFLVNITTAGNLATSLGIASDNTLECVVGAALIHRLAGGTKVFEQPRNLFQFLLLAALQERKIIERAKGILMKRANLDEAAAFQRLQKMARDTNRKLVQVAEMLLTAEQAYHSE